MPVFIFSGPIHSGKTSNLLDWSSRQKNIAGILMPDINGSRKILDLQTKNIFDIECKDVVNAKEPIIVVGNFYFYAAAFEKANLILMNALAQKPAWLLIDEAGKLELEGKGFYPSIVKAVVLYKQDESPGNLLITVRESLCDEVISFFNIKEFKVISSLDALT